MDASTTTAPAAVFQAIPINQIKPSRHQARKDFDEEGIKQLAASVEKEDLLQPITVRKVGEEYELIAGERRLRAVKSLGRPTIDARVIEVVNEAAACAKGLVENLQRKDLNPIEEAEGFAELNKLDPTYWTQVKIAEITGKSKSHISESARFLGFSDKIKDEFRRRNFTEGHGAELLRLPSKQLQDKVAGQIKNKDLGVHETRAVVNKLLAKASPPAPLPRGEGGRRPGEASFKFSGKDMDAWVTFSGQYPIIGNWDDFVVNLKKAYDAWRAKGMSGGKKALAKPSTPPAHAPSYSLSSAISKLSPEELAALGDIAKDGPGPIYAKLLPGTALAKMMEHSKWSDFGAKDVSDGLPLMLAALKDNTAV